MENVEEVKKKCKGKENQFGRRYGFGGQLRCVKLRLEARIAGIFIVQGGGSREDSVIIG